MLARVNIDSRRDFHLRVLWPAQRAESKTEKFQQSRFGVQEGSRCETGTAPATVTGDKGETTPLGTTHASRLGRPRRRMNRESGNLLLEALIVSG